MLVMTCFLFNAMISSTKVVRNLQLHYQQALKKSSPHISCNYISCKSTLNSEINKNEINMLLV